MNGEAMRNRLELVPLFACLCVIACLLTACGAPRIPDAESLGVDSQLAGKGRALRHAIDNRYRSPAGHYHPSGSVVISDVAVIQIPIGSNMAEAIDILKSAGFEVGKPHPSLFDRGQTTWSCHIKGYRAYLVAGTTVGILLSASNEDPLTVSKVEGSIYNDLL